MTVLAFVSFIRLITLLTALLDSAAFPLTIPSPIFFIDVLASESSSLIASYASFALIIALVIIAYIL